MQAQPSLKKGRKNAASPQLRPKKWKEKMQPHPNPPLKKGGSESAFGNVALPLNG